MCGHDMSCPIGSVPVMPVQRQPLPKGQQFGLIMDGSGSINCLFPYLLSHPLPTTYNAHTFFHTHNRLPVSSSADPALQLEYAIRKRSKTSKNTDLFKDCKTLQNCMAPFLPTLNKTRQKQDRFFVVAGNRLLEDLLCTDC